MPMNRCSEGSEHAHLTATIGHLAARWAGADKRILRPVFALLAAGSPVTVERIAAASGDSKERVEQALAAGRAGRDPDGRVVELSGMSLKPTMHRLMIDGVALFGCCALLSHLTTFLLDRPVSIESIDPLTRRIVRLTVSPQEAIADTAGAVGTLVAADAASMAASIGAAFCTHVRHFSSRQSADEFAAADPRRCVVQIAELHAAAQSLYRAAWA